MVLIKNNQNILKELKINTIRALAILVIFLKIQNEIFKSCLLMLMYSSYLFSIIN